MQRKLVKLFAIVKLCNKNSVISVMYQCKYSVVESVVLHSVLIYEAPHSEKPVTTHDLSHTPCTTKMANRPTFIAAYWTTKTYSTSNYPKKSPPQTRKMLCLQTPPTHQAGKIQTPHCKKMSGAVTWQPSYTFAFETR